MAERPVSTIYLLKRAELAVRGCVEVALGRVDLTPNQYFILVLVKSREASSSAELARAMGVLPQSMTELIAPLEKQGAIVRRPDRDNNRILRIELTAAGERLYAKATEVAIRVEQELLEDLEATELGRLNGLLADLTLKAEAHSYHPKLRRLTKRTAKKVEPSPATPAATMRRRAGGKR